VRPEDQHEFQDAVETARQRLDGIANEVRSELPHVGAAERVLFEDLLSFLDDAASEKELLGRDETKSFLKGLSLLTEAEKRLFVLRNTLEAMKRGEDPKTTLLRYRELGLLKGRSDEAFANLKDIEGPPIDGLRGPVSMAAMWCGKQIKRASAVVAAVSTAAFKAIPGLVGVKMSVTFVGGLPCPSFSFEGGEATATLGQFWELISEALKHAPA
jgi:hypothetical protein